MRLIVILFLLSIFYYNCECYDVYDFDNEEEAAEFCTKEVEGHPGFYECVGYLSSMFTARNRISTGKGTCVEEFITMEGNTYYYCATSIPIVDGLYNYLQNLFTRPDGTPFQFHLADLSDKLLSRYRFIIERNGGEVTLKPDELILTFTEAKSCYKYRFVYNIEFIDDCLRRNQILDLDDYFIGDKRFFNACRMPKGVWKISTFKCPECEMEHFKENGQQTKNSRKILTAYKKFNKS